MKVYQINTVCNLGSTGKIAAEINDVLQKNGYNGCIAYGRGNCVLSNTVKMGNKASVLSHFVISRFTDRQGFYSTFATKKLIENIKKYNPDIIHLHNIHGYYINIKLLFEFLKSFKKPVVWTLHDCWAFTGHCAYFDYAKCERWKTGCYNCPQKRSYPASWILDNSEKNYFDKLNLFTEIENLTIVTPSYWLADTVKKSFLKKYPIEVIYNGINLDVFKPTYGNFKEKYNIVNKKILLGVANVWETRKGFDDFLKLSKIIPDDYVIVLVGLSKSKISRLPKNVIGITRTDNISELAEIYTVADIYVNMSYEETMGLTTVEALACGTPSIVYNKTAVPEIVDKTCGMVVSAGDVNAVLKAIYECDFGAEACIKRARFFEKEKQFLKYINLYENILKK